MSEPIVFVGPGVAADAATLGGKGAGLAFLEAGGVRVPPAFVVTADGYREALGKELRDEVAARIAAIPADAHGDALERQAAAIRALIFEGTAGHALRGAVDAAYAELRVRGGDPDLAVAVRSSSIAEDAADKSFAGEHDTYLWVSGAEELDRRLRECWASLATTRAVAYRRDAEAEAGAGAGVADELAMAVVVQQMAPAVAAGVFMTLNPVNGDRSKVMIESVWGLGEPLVSGEANPDRFLVDKVTGEVVSRELADKTHAAVRDPETGRGVISAEVERERRGLSSLSDEEIAELVRIARLVERRGGKPQDGEFAVVPGSAPENVQLVQCRPETVWSQRPRASLTGGRSAMQSVLSVFAPNAADARES